jgi:hypothetical protein
MHETSVVFSALKVGARSPLLAVVQADKNNKPFFATRYARAEVVAILGAKLFDDFYFLFTRN